MWFKEGKARLGTELYFSFPMARIKNPVWVSLCAFSVEPNHTTSKVCFHMTAELFFFCPSFFLDMQ